MQRRSALQICSTDFYQNLKCSEHLTQLTSSWLVDVKYPNHSKLIVMAQLDCSYHTFVLAGVLGQ